MRKSRLEWIMIEDPKHGESQDLINTKYQL